MAYAARGVDWSAPHPAINKPAEREQFRDEPHYSVLPPPFLFLLLRLSSCRSCVVRLSRPLSSFYLTHAINDSARARCITGAFEKRPATCSRVLGISTSRRTLKASRTFSFHALISFFPGFFPFFLPPFSSASLFSPLKTSTRTGLVYHRDFSQPKAHALPPGSGSAAAQISIRLHSRIHRLVFFLLRQERSHAALTNIAIKYRSYKNVET